MYSFYRLNNPVAERDFQDVERHQKGRGHLKIPLIEPQSLRSVVPGSLQVGCESGGRKDVWQVVFFVGCERPIH